MREPRIRWNIDFLQWTTLDAISFDELRKRWVGLSAVNLVSFIDSDKGPTPYIYHEIANLQNEGGETLYTPVNIIEEYHIWEGSLPINTRGIEEISHLRKTFIH